MKKILLGLTLLTSLSSYADFPVKTNVKGDLSETGYCSVDNRLINIFLKYKCAKDDAELDDGNVGIKIIKENGSCLIKAVSFCKD